MSGELLRIDSAVFNGSILAPSSFSYPMVENEPEPCGEVDRSVGLLYVTMINLESSGSHSCHSSQVVSSCT